ncbi:MAG: hypothetical protein K2X35_23985 [Bryobacteraceae bacterium]|nr:hypothetical protein [Bryobacteraceae bacterium]
MAFEIELMLAIDTAHRAADLARQHQERGVNPERKSDSSPVTIADRECELLIASALENAFPLDGVLGEEGAAKDSRSGRRWIIDPIDGTRDFIRGTPLWCVLIALEAAGEVQLGVAHVPGLGITSWAVRGGGAYRDGSPLRVSAVSDPQQAFVSLNGLDRLVAGPLWNHLGGFAARSWGVRSLGGTPDALLLAEGALDAWIEPKVAPWDLAAVQVIIEEAGGVFGNFEGSRGIYAGSAWAATPGLAPVLRALLVS